MMALGLAVKMEAAKGEMKDSEGEAAGDVIWIVCYTEWARSYFAVGWAGPYWQHRRLGTERGRGGAAE